MSFMELMPQLLEGLKVTLKVFFLTLIFSLPLGVIISLGRISKFKILQKITGLYVLILRGTPLLLQIIFIYFGLPAVGISVPREPAALIAMILNYAAYFAEIFRAGILSIDKGQYEGAEVLGLSSKDTFFRIILPQAFKRILPPVANEVITLVKDTSLVYVVGLDDLLKIGKIANNRYASLVPLIFVGVIYLILVAIFTKVFALIEKKFNYYE
ncbi:MAG: amino acid ABC transporter permease [Clostridium sp.]|nr:amino acid ABC transporter permease [Clostridium sp.]MCI7443533.1 amino acid ABC transporter permease [Clostridium sp.]MDY4077426.1 amino acid ABC transporter permease [Clostridium sp.]